MADISMGQIFRRGFKGVFGPGGRDDRTQFWLFSAFVFGPILGLQVVVQMVLSFSSIDLSGAKAAAGAAALNAQFFETAATIGYVNLALHSIGALLLVAAAARRLHDRNRSGWWSLILPFAVVAVGLDQARRMDAMAREMGRWMSEAQHAPPEGIGDIFAFSAKLQAAMPGPDWPAIVAGVAMLWLAIELVRAGTPGDNRYGAQP
jgi:uncharacterized membrane protein YhaH (DUF805 family)